MELLYIESEEENEMLKDYIKSAGRLIINYAFKNKLIKLNWLKPDKWYSFIKKKHVLTNLRTISCINIFLLTIP